jgi:hypothetical protein
MRETKLLKMDSVAILLIDTLVSIDQAVRTNPEYSRIGVVDTAFTRCNTFDETYQYLRMRIKILLTKRRWPGISKLGIVGDTDLWGLVQHLDYDVDYQTKILRKMWRALIHGDTRPANYAYLYDRIQVNKGKPQLFETQIKYVDSSTCMLRALVDSSRVDRLRAAVLLTPIDKYKTYSSKYFSPKKANK